MPSLTKEQRDALTESDFGIPEERMYPLHDESHVESAVKLFSHAPVKKRKSLAQRILSKAREYKMDTSGWKQVLGYAQEESTCANAQCGDELLQRLDTMSMHQESDQSIESFRTIPLTESNCKKYARDHGSFDIGLNNIRTGKNVAGCIFIDADDNVVAYVGVEKKDNGEHWIVGLEVSKEYQQNGYGSQLLEYAVKQLNAEFLSVNKNNNKALNMYKSSGWVVYDETDYMYFMKYKHASHVEESPVERINDEGKEVPETCDKCGSKVEIHLKGEPVWCCSNKKCGKYFGTVPCNINEAFEEGMCGVLPNWITARAATKEDIDIITEMELETIPKEYRDKPEVIKDTREDAEWSVGFTTMIIQKLINKPIGIYQSRPTNYEATSASGDWWYIADIFILPEYRHQGIGRALISYDIANHDKLVLRVNANNVKAYKLYQKLGFKVTEQYDDGEIIMRIDKTSTIQEGAFQDLKNGVNPKSKKLFFHVSFDDSLAQKILEPRIPTYLVEDKEQVKTNEELGLHEDDTTPRVCFSPSIEGCLNAIISEKKRLRLAGKPLFVYVPEKPIEKYRHKTNEEIIRDKDVFDAPATGEMWILEPVGVKLYGVIVVDQISDRKKTHVADKESPNWVHRYTYKWHWHSKPKLFKEGAKTVNQTRISRFFQEDGEDTSMEDITVGDINLDDETDMSEENASDTQDTSDDSPDEEATTTDDQEPGGIPDYLRNRLSDDDLAELEDSDDDLPVDENLNVNNVDLGKFGTDTSDVHNDYDQKEVDLLMKLMASEGQAMAEYLDGAKETNVDVLRRLYADIANEERFHMEQLLFAKSELTGEKYEPRDPDVKHEYEELLAMGMDEETAMNTAVDKCHIRGSIQDDDLEDFQADVEVVESLMTNFSMNFDNMLMIAESSQFSREDFDHAIDVFAEACIFTEDVANVSNEIVKPGLKVSKNPLQILSNALGFLVGLIVKLVQKFTELLRRIRNHSRNIKTFIKNNGLPGLFAQGVHLYFYDPSHPTELPPSLAQYYTLVWSVVYHSARSIDIQVPPPSGNLDPGINPGADIDKGISILNGAHLLKKKVVVPQDTNAQEQMAEWFFGYTAGKAQNGKSNNIYNSLTIISDSWKKLLSFTKSTVDQANSLQNNMNSVYTRDRRRYDKAVSGLEAATKSCKAFISALSSDLATLTKLDNGLMQRVSQMDQNDAQQNPQIQAAQQAYQNRFHSPT